MFKKLTNINSNNLKHFLMFNLIIVAYYFAILLNLNTGINFEIMFASSDSQTYFEVAEWITSEKDTIWTIDRPFLFPLLIAVASKISLVNTLWFFQFIFWLVSVNTLYRILLLITSNNKLIAYFGVIIFLSNISLIVLTLHALTEISTVFLLSLLVLFITKNIKQRKQLSFIHTVILYLSILVVIKPVFFIPLLIILGLLLLFYSKGYLKDPKKILTLVVIMIPVIIQLSIMKVKHDKLTISTISTQTLDKYIIAQGIQKLEGGTWVESQSKSLEMKKFEKIELVLANKMLFFDSYLSNLNENIKADAQFLRFPKELEHPFFLKFMRNINKGYYYLHFLFLLPMLILIFRFLRQKNYESLILLLSLFGLYSYYILVTGISFMQGDRLVLPTIILWIPLYIFVAFNLINPNFKITTTIK